MTEINFFEFFIFSLFQAYGAASIAGVSLAISLDSPLRSFYSSEFSRISSFLLSRLHRERHKNLLASVYGSTLLLDAGIGGSLDDFPVSNNITSVIAVGRNFSDLRSIMDRSDSHGFSKNFLSFYRADSLEFIKSQPQNSFESIVADFSLSRYSEEELKNYLKEIERILKPGGHFYFIEREKSSGLKGILSEIINPAFKFFTLGRSLNSSISAALVASPFDRIYLESWPSSVDRQNPRLGIQLIYSGSTSEIRSSETEIPRFSSWFPLVAGIAEKNRGGQSVYQISSGNASTEDQAKEMMQKVLGFGSFK